METAQRWVEQLALEPHPEGGYFREVYRSNHVIAAESLPSRYDGPHVCATLITFLLPGDQVSRLHRLRSDEIWHFYLGSPLTLHRVDPDGSYRAVKLGPDPSRGQGLQVVIPHGCWFGATVDDPTSFSLVGCTVAPGFEYADFELAERQALLTQYPQHRELIERLTRPASEAY